MIRLKSLLSATFGAAILLAALPSAFAADNTFKVGTDPDYRPISFSDPSGKLIGVDPDFATELAKHMGRGLNYEGIAWEGIIPALQAGKIDAITNLVITDKRKETVAFSEPYLAQTVTTVVPANKPDLNPTPEALKGLRVGVMVNTAAAGVLAKIAGVNTTIYNTVADEYSDLLLGRIDAVVIESINAYYTTKAMYNGKLRVTGVPLSDSKQLIAVAMRKDSAALISEVNKGIEAMRSDGSLDQIAKKWFGDTAIVAKP